MRWEALFADMEAQLVEAARAEAAAEVSERTRAEWARTALADRLRACLGRGVQLVLVSGERLSGTCADVAPEWLVLDEGRAQVLVPLRAVAGVSGLPRDVAPPAGAVARRLGLGHALRALARDRVGVRVVTSGGMFSGTIDRVGADHLDLAEHAPGEQRRARDVRGVVSVPFRAVLAVRAA